MKNSFLILIVCIAFLGVANFTFASPDDVCNPHCVEPEVCSISGSGAVFLCVPRGTSPASGQPVPPAASPLPTLGANVVVMLRNPLGIIESFPGLLTAIATFISGLIASIVVIMFVYAGFLYVISAGSPDKIKKARDALLYAVIGAAIALSVQGLLAVITAAMPAPPTGTGITNPLGATSTLSGLLTKIAKFISGVIASIAVIMFVYAGFLYVISAGEPDKRKRAKDVLLYAVIGVAIALSVQGLLAVIKAVLNVPTT